METEDSWKVLIIGAHVSPVSLSLFLVPSQSPSDQCRAKENAQPELDAESGPTWIERCGSWKVAEKLPAKTFNGSTAFKYNSTTRVSVSAL